MSGDMCDDGREKIIEPIKRHILDATNATEEFAQSFAMRCWQLGYRRMPNGTWKQLKRGDVGFSAGDFKCEACGKVYRLGSLQTIYDVKRLWKFCPTCGARMDGDRA